MPTAAWRLSPSERRTSFSSRSCRPDDVRGFDWGPGDAFVGNDPDYGGGHLPDYLVYAPAYDDFRAQIPGLMLGILSADSRFAGGSFSLTRKGVEEAFRNIGAEMGYGSEEAAFDCWRVVNANMTQAVRGTTAGKGIHPKDMVMLAYGGNGPVFAAVQAEELGIERASGRLLHRTVLRGTESIAA